MTDQRVSGVDCVGVVGCGLMGSGIAQVVAQAGYRTIVREVNDELLSAGLGRIRASVAKAVERGKLDEASMHATAGHLEGTTDLAALSPCQLVIEAVTEDIDAKCEVFVALDQACGDQTIFASNTSSLSITTSGNARSPSISRSICSAGTTPPVGFPGLLRMISRVRSLTCDSTWSASNEKPVLSCSSIGTGFAPVKAITDS